MANEVGRKDDLLDVWPYLSVKEATAVEAVKENVLDILPAMIQENPTSWSQLSFRI